MHRHIGFAVLVVGLAVAACGSSSTTGTSSTSAAGSGSGGTSSGGGSSTGAAAGTTGATGATGAAATSAAAGSSSGTGGSPTASGGGSTTGSAAGTGTGGIPATVSTFAGNCGTFGEDSAFSPQMLVVDGAGTIYVTDTNVDVVSPAGATVLGSQEDAPNGLAVTPDGGVYYSLTQSFGGHTEIYAIEDGGSSLFFDQPPSCSDSPSADAGFGQVVGLAADDQGTVYVADEACFKVRKRTADGTISTLSGTGTSGHKDGAGDVAKFSQLAAMAMDSSGNIYVYESDAVDIRKIQPDGTTNTVANGLTNLGGFVVAGDGTIYFSNFANNTIGKVAPGGAITTIAGNGNSGLVNGAAGSAEFDSPVGIGLDPAGNLFIADSSNCVVRGISGL